MNGEILYLPVSLGHITPILKGTGLGPLDRLQSPAKPYIKLENAQTIVSRGNVKAIFQAGYKKSDPRGTV